MHRFIRYLDLNNLILVFAFLIPSGFYKLSGILIGILIILWIVEKRYRFARSELIKHMIPIWLLFSLFLFSLLYTKDIISGFKEIGQHVILLILPLIFVTLDFTSDLKLKIRKAFILSTIIFVGITDLYAIIDIAVSGISKISIDESVYHKYSSYGLTRIFDEWHPTYVSLSLVISTIFVFESIEKRNQVLKILVILFFALNVYFLNSLIGIATFIAVVFYYLLQYKKYILLIAIALLSAIFFSTSSGINKLEKIAKMEIYPSDKEGNKNTLNVRLAKWDSCLDVIKQAPILGVSPGDNKKVLLNMYIHNKYFFCAEKKFGPHNEYLYILTCFGLIGFLVFIYAFLYPLKVNFSTETVLIILSFGTFFLTEDILEREQGLFLWVFLYSLVLKKTIITE